MGLGEGESTRMAELPDLQESPRSLGQLVALARDRKDAGWSIDPLDGCFRRASLELETRAETILLFLEIALWVACAVTALFTRGGVFLGLATITAALSAWMFLRVWRNAGRLREHRRNGRVVAGAFVQANEELYEQGLADQRSFRPTYCVKSRKTANPVTDSPGPET